MIELASYTQTLLESGSEQELSTIFQLIEEMLLDGSDTVKSAVITGFLETIVNAVEKGVAVPAAPRAPARREIQGVLRRVADVFWRRFARHFELSKTLSLPVPDGTGAGLTELTAAVGGQPPKIIM